MNVTATFAAVLLAAGGGGGDVAPVETAAPAPSVTATPATAPAPVPQQWAPFSPWWMAPAPVSQQGQGEGGAQAPASPFGMFPVFIMFPFGGMSGAGEAGQQVSFPWAMPWGQQGQQQQPVSWPSPTAVPTPAETPAPVGDGVVVELPSPTDRPALGDAGDDTEYHKSSREDVYIGTPPENAEQSGVGGDKAQAESFDTERGKREKEGREGK